MDHPYSHGSGRKWKACPFPAFSSQPVEVSRPLQESRPRAEPAGVGPVPTPLGPSCVLSRAEVGAAACPSEVRCAGGDAGRIRPAVGPGSTGRRLPLCPVWQGPRLCLTGEPRDHRVTPTQPSLSLASLVCASVCRVLAARLWGRGRRCGWKCAALLGRLSQPSGLFLSPAHRAAPLPGCVTPGSSLTLSGLTRWGVRVLWGPRMALGAFQLP